MALGLVVVIVIIIFAIINPILKYSGKRQLDDDYALPIGFFLIMCYLAFYEFNIPFFHVLVVFIFGLVIGELIQNIDHKKKNKKN